MPSVPISKSRQIALDRVAQCLQEQYATELAAIADTNLYLPAPEAAAYYMVPMDPDEVPLNHNVAVFIYPAGLRARDSDDGSGGADTGEKQKRNLPVDVTVLCRRAMYDKDNKPVTRNGKTLIHDEVLRLRAERYTGAMIKCLLTYCSRGVGGIVDIDLTDDMPDILFDRESGKPVWGIATAQFELTQKVRVPLSRTLP